MTLAGCSLVQDGPVAIVVDEGYMLLPGAAGLLRAAIEQGATAATGAVRVESADGIHAARWQPRGGTALDALADPRSVPPVWAAPAAALAALHAEADLCDLAVVDLWVQLVSDRPAEVLDATIARRTVSGPTRWERLLASPAYAQLFERLLRRHQQVVEVHIRELIIEREIAYGRLRGEHQALLARRDAALEELDRVRAAAAHRRAFLSHHRVDAVSWGSFDQPYPIARDWGYARGGPVDRRYIREFVARHSSDIHGHVLEVQEDDLTRLFGGTRVTDNDVLDIDRANARATVIADLRAARALPDDAYDALILTQTAHVIDDMAAVLRECRRVLKPGGVLLATFPSVSRVCLEYGPDGDFWRVTPAGARMLFQPVFGDDVQVDVFGNVKTTMAFLHGLGEHELTDADYAVTDPYNPMLVGVRAVKRAALVTRRHAPRGVVLLYHQVGAAGRDPFDLSIPTDLFKAQLEALARHAVIVDLETLLTAAPGDLPDCAVALTFDDGYAAHLTEVLPILESAGAPATFFVTTAGLERDVEYWWDTLADVNPPDLRARHDRLVQASLEERTALMQSIGPASGTPPRPLRADELRRLAAGRRVTIGAHSVNHLLLPAQPARVRRFEMEESRRAIEAAVQRPVTMFAYPYGASDGPTSMDARESFAWAFDCEGSAIGESFDAARVPRVDVKAWSAGDLASRLDALFANRRGERRVSFLP